MEDETFYVCDLRLEFSGNKYITFWRAHNSNYAYPLAWSGKYSRRELKPGYHEVYRHESRIIERFPVPCVVADGLGVMSKPSEIDGGPTLCVKNTEKNRRILRKGRITLGSSASSRGTDAGL